jgi:chromosome segregation ATPase
MFVELPNELIFIAAGAFLLGWILSAISSSIGARFKAKRRDSRDDRIRELEAELRIAQAEQTDSRTDVEKLEDELKETTIGLERRDNVISDQQTKLEKATSDLKSSVIKTRELRSELTERATENVHAEAKIREVETELSVAQASTDMIATGVLDYSFKADKQDTDESLSENDHTPEEPGKASL